MRYKNTKLLSQRQIILGFFQRHTATARQAAQATGIPVQNICKLKKELEQAGLLKEVGRVKVPATQRFAYLLTAKEGARV